MATVTSSIVAGMRCKTSLSAGSLNAKDARKIFDDPLTTELKPLNIFYIAEVYHQDYFANNPNAPYCTFVIAPKIDKLSKKGTIWND